VASQTVEAKPDYFRRADDLRKTARDWPDGASKREMLKLADEWDAMARRQQRFGPTKTSTETF